ncbi:MAG: hypothetical protein H6741_07910 [Alphaproteobacteria bacterium]|nr:hypothetical protein [Alphaproteobacteria bacterium]
MMLPLLLLACSGGDAPAPTPTEAPAKAGGEQAAPQPAEAPAPKKAPGQRLQALVATSGAGVDALLDGDPKQGWTPKGDAVDEGVLLRFEAPVDLTKVEVTGCGAGWDISGELFVNGATASVFTLAAGATHTWSADEPTATRSLFLRVAHGNKACIGELKLTTDSGPLDVGPPRRAAATVSASSVLTPEPAYSPSYLFDSRTDFGWVEGAADLGEGQSVTVTFEEPRAIGFIELWNGYQRSPDHFNKNARAKRIAVTVDDSAPVELAVADTQGPQKLELPAPLVGKKLTLTIVEATPGSKYKDLVLSELRFWDQEGPFVAQVDHAGPASAATAKAVKGSSLEPLVDKAWAATCESEELSAQLKLRSDNSFVWYYESGVDGDTQREVFDGAWVVKEAGPVWSTIKLYGRRHSTSSSWNPYGSEGDSVTESVRIAGGDVQVGALSKIGEAELAQTVMDLEEWTWCHDQGLATALQGEGAVVLQGAAMSGVIAPRQ